MSFTIFAMFVAPVSLLLICCVTVTIFSSNDSTESTACDVPLLRTAALRWRVNPSVHGLGLRCAHLSRRAVPGFDSLDRVLERLLQNPLSDRPDHQADQPSLEVLAIAYGDEVNIGQAVGTTREGVGVAGRPSPRVGVGRL